ncbi:WD repeat-containing protein 60 [Argiope bruennichi]|uniref:WD repeat-containing protein 60 n=1 Tax=Argiope bruennichi TaxID=94029 RepID=A0A8T0E3Y4_ARGBR|nr:WD repeat-containing protein 60 [Argiope bruennichi]KAF8764161.1 WD repeat-containing protein 60 [Argiope bruennichi]
MSQKTNLPKRKVKQEKIKDSKIDKDSENSKPSPAIRETIRNEKYRSGSLNRHIPAKAQESPRKSQSVDRNQSVRSKINDAGIRKSPQQNASKPSNNAASKKKNIRDSQTSNNKVETRSNPSTSNSKKSISTTLKKKNSDKPVKVNDGKTNAQIAKSFVKNSQSRLSKSTKSSNEQKSQKKQESPKHEISHSPERPRTSTIRKGVPENVNLHIKDEIGSPVLTSNSSLSGSKNSLKIESDDDKASYEEDFEDYDSDFEESDTESISESDTTSSSMEEQEEILLDVQIEENSLKNSSPLVESTKVPDNLNMPVIKEKINYLKMSDRSSLHSEKSIKDLPEKKPIKLSRSFINFQTAIEKEESNCTNQHLNDSPSDLEKADISNEEINFPVVTYTSINKPNSKQVFVQTELCDDEEVQTCEIELVNKWTQFPTKGTSGYGGDTISSNDDKVAAWKSLFNVQSTKLTSFLQKSSNVILTLLDEEFTAFNDEFKTKKRQGLFYSDGYYVLSPLNFLSGVPVIQVYCSENSPYIITIYGNMIELPFENDTVMEKGIICVWNAILTANSQPSCGTFGPGFSDVVIAGMVDGAVMLWDLTELSSNHFQMKTDVPIILRSPTYNTALILATESHSSCIAAIQAVTNNSKEDWRSSGSLETGSSKNFHVITLEDMGVINIWVVVEVLKPDISGLETDLGLAPGGKYRLVRSSRIPLFSLATLSGIILHVTRHSGSIEPRFYAADTEFSSEIRCIDCSPHNDDLFLVGSSDGSIRLYNTKLVRPLLEFSFGAKGEPVNLLKWSVVHPAIFCVLSSSSHIHFWNIMENSIEPFQTYHFEDCKVTWFAFRNVDRNRRHGTSDKLSNFVISKENGEVEVHSFQAKITEEEYLKQLEYMKNL